MDRSRISDSPMGSRLAAADATIVPADGDVIVTSESPQLGGFTISQHPNEEQFRAGTLDAALVLARPFAQRHNLNVWLREGSRWRLIEAFSLSSTR